jgi:L-ascorbate metabolism protein UlaG (beta-lactamase superfamily)
MNISWHGLSCFEISTKGMSGEATLVIDPYQNSTGLRFPRTLEAQAVAVTHEAEHANNVESVLGNPFVIRHPGEYEVKGMFLYGIRAPRAQESKEEPKENIIYRLEIEGMSLAHLGSLDRELTDEELEHLKNIDVLMLPVGGGRVMTSRVAASVMAQVEPRLVIPMTHAIANVKEKLASVDDFCKEMGLCQREETTKLKLTRKDLPEEETKIVVLTR